MTLSSSDSPPLSDPSLEFHMVKYTDTTMISLTSKKSYIAPLGVPWHLEKGQPFLDMVEYLGFLWDIPNHHVTLTPSKCQKYIIQLSSFLSTYEHQWVSKNEDESVTSYLNHCTFTFPHGNSYLANVYSWLASFPNKHSHSFIPRSVISNLKWWLNILQNHLTSCLLLPKPSTYNYNIWVNASSGYGIGLIWNSQWFYWETVKNWCGFSGAGCDIRWLKAITIELAIHHISLKGIHNTNVLIKSDNEGAIQAFNKGHSHNHMVNGCIRRSNVILMDLNLFLTLLYVPSETNLVDPISCGSLPDISTRLNTPPSISNKITQWFKHDQQPAKCLWWTHGWYLLELWYPD